MEPPTRDSLMTTSVAMTTISLLPPDLLNMFLPLRWRKPFMPHRLSCCHSLQSLNTYMVMETTKSTCFSMPYFMFITNNMIVIEMNIRILRVVIHFLLGAEIAIKKAPFNT